MRWFFAWVLWVSALAGSGEPAWAGKVRASSKKGVRPAKRRPLHAAPRPSQAFLHPASAARPPAGEQAVYWAEPQKPRLGVKVRLLPSRESAVLGELRGETAVALKLDGDRLAMLHRPGCRAWLNALPE